MAEVVKELFARLSLDVDETGFNKFESALANVTKGVGGFVTAVEAMAVAVIGSAFYVGNLGDEIGDTAEKLGLSTTALQELRYAATLSDTSVESLQMGLKFLGVSAAQAAQGSESDAKAFARLGVTIKDSAGNLKPIEQLFEEVAAGMGTLGSQAEKNAAALAIFGRQGVELSPLLNKGAEGVAALRAEANQLGVVLDGSTIAAAGEFDNELKRIKATMQGLVLTLGKEFLPRLNLMLKAIQKIIVLLAPVASAISNTVSLLFDLFKGLFDLFLSTGPKAALTLGTIATALTGVFLAGGPAAVVLGALLFQLASLAAPLVPFALFVLLADDLYGYLNGADSELGNIIARLDSFDPSGNSVLELLKSIGSVIFDLGDPAKWRRVGAAILGVLSPVIEMMSSFFDAIGATTMAQTGRDIAGALTVKADEVRNNVPDTQSAFNFSGGAASPSAAQNLSTTNNRASTVFSPVITINAPAGANADEYARTIQREIDKWSQSMASDVAVVGGAR